MKRRCLIAAPAVGALGLAACGGDDDDSVESRTTDGAAIEVPADWPNSIVFTPTPSQETGVLIETAQPLADVLSDRLAIGVEALVPSDHAGVIVALQFGRAQVAGGLGPAQ